MRPLSIIVLLLLSAGLCPLTAQQNHRLLLAPLATRDWQSPIPDSAENLEAGKAVYEENCAQCHGLDGKSRLASNADLPVMPADLTTFFVESLRDGELYFISTRGILSTVPGVIASMPGFRYKLEENQHWQLVQYLRELRRPQKAEELKQLGPYPWNLPLGFPYPKGPADNPMTVEKVYLGRRLFYDKRLSMNQTQSCATCHKQELAFTDGKPRGVGSTGEVHPRGAMSLVNVAYSPVLTWANPNLDRLSEQALAPMFGDDPVELGMGGQEDLLAERIGADPVYQRLFAAAYPDEPQPYTVDNITKALGSFQRTILSGDSPYDRYRRGDDLEAISPSARRGETLFFSERLECAHCHGGLNFTANIDYFAKGFAEIEFHNNGLYNLAGEFNYPKRNLGLFQFTRAPEDVGKFKPPTLRNIAVTAPYMHDGSVATLSDVLDHYAAGGRTIVAGDLAGVGAENPNKSELIKPFQLTEQERADVIAFLESLTDETLLTNPAFADPWPKD